MTRNNIFFYILPTIQVNPTTAYIAVSWLKWHWSKPMRVCKFNDWLLKIADLKWYLYWGIING